MFLNCTFLSRLKVSNFHKINCLKKYHTLKGVYGYIPQAKDPYFVSTEALDNRTKHSNIYRLITAYRQHGHKQATLDPITTLPIQNIPELDPCRYIDDPTSDISIPVLGLLNAPKNEAAVSELIILLQKIYCGPIGLEFQHLQDEEKREWLETRFEELQTKAFLSVEEKKSLSIELLKSQIFDNFLATKFSTVKRYGGEGAESMMGFFLEILKSSSSYGISDIVIGMPHRGRLNLLTGLLKFPPVIMFQKMRGLPEFPETLHRSGDVLSHLFTSVDIESLEGTVHVSLLPNPSHLEAISPVIVGKARARLQSLKAGDYSANCSKPCNCVLPIQVHGDGSFAGQGIVMETLAMANAPHFSVGGSIHLVVNNQIGFTTPADRGRSSFYCSDIMKMINAPIIHVNGDYPEDIIKATRLAVDYRQKFNEDVLIDLICFRRWGHNEMDDPMFTNPAMYNVIHSRNSVPDLYSRKLMEEGIWHNDDTNNINKEHTAFLNDHFKQIEVYKPKAYHLQKRWKDIIQAPSAIFQWNTGIAAEALRFIGTKSVQTPEDFNIHPHLNKVYISDRLKKIAEGNNLDWATAEALAFGSLLCQGYNVRISGQDVGRGTFSHRHAMLVDQETNEIHIPLNHILDNQMAFYEVANSILSEEGVLGFEYGMSLESPNNLVVWEAQFGDFFNGAQIIIDTLVSSGEMKWSLQSGLVILLPHGYDGAGPEHSSCRIERFLQMCDSKEDCVDGENVNWQVVHPTTPAQYFHLLRRQVLRNFRKPLIVMAPKLLLRLPSATSPLSDMSPGTTFSPVIGDYSLEPSLVKNVILCSGKHYYLLQKERESRGKMDTALIRLESLCPFPAGELSEELKKYKKAINFVWSQEEHQNMGPWFFVKPRIQNLLGCKLTYAGRGPLSPPAVGIGQLHQKEIQQVLNMSFTS